MNGISSSGKENIGNIIEEMFDNIALHFLGNLPRFKNKKIMTFSTSPNVGLSHLFVQAMENRVPNSIEQDMLRGLLDTADGYIQAVKSQSKSNLIDRIDGLTREASARGEKANEQELQAAITEEMNKARFKLQTIVESEATKLRNLGTLMSITRMAASVGDNDPTVFFAIVRDNVTCKECIRLHTVDGTVPRLWKFSELKQSYHKRGEDKPSLFGLHPHCFTEDSMLHTSNGLISLKDLFLSGENQEVFVDNRIKNRKTVGNQYGSPIPGEVWLDRHTSGANKFSASNVYDTGIQECIKITLTNGFSLSVSLGHEMWIDDDKSGIKIQAKEIKIGDKIPLISGECGFGSDNFPELAELMGNLMGDGSILKSTAQWNFFGDDLPYGEHLYSLMKSHHTHWSTKDQLTINPSNEKYNVASASFNSSIMKKVFIEEFGLSKKPRRVPERLWKASKVTIAAFLRGLYAADGHVEKSPGIVLAQNDVEFLKEIQLLLSNFGLIASINKHGDQCIKKITYADGRSFDANRKPCWRLNLGGWDQCAIFAKEIGMGVPKKNERLHNFLSITEGKTKHGSWRTSRVSSIETLGKLQTYCLTEPMTNTLTVNGFVTGNCRCTLNYLTRGFGFDGKGKLSYQSEGFDLYSQQRKINS